MRDPEDNQPLTPDTGDELQEADPALDLNLDEFEEVKDLQALADEVAESTVEPSRPETGGDADVRLVRALQRIADLEQREAGHKDKYHRLLADFANHRNRVGRETQLAVTLAEKKLLLELLPVVDNFERCLSTHTGPTEEFHNGVGLIHRQLLEMLRKAGVAPVDVKVGDPFDAMHAEALTTTSTPDLPDGAVAAVFERGYMLHDLLLRPARVIVNHAHAAPAPSADSNLN